MKARIKIMIIAIICLSVVVLGEAVIISGIYAKCKSTEKALREYQETLTDLSNIYDRAVTSRNELEKLNYKYVTENKRLSEELYRSEKEIERLNVVLEQQKEPERCQKAASMFLPAGIDTNMFTAEPYNKFLKNTDQAILQEECYTEYESGLRYYLIDGYRYYCAALAGAFGVEIGNTYEFTLENGFTFNVILADFKHPIADARADDFGDICPSGNYDGRDAMCVVEFVADFAYMPKAVKDAGTYSALDRLGGLYGTGGNIVECKFTGRKWKA